MKFTFLLIMMLVSFARQTMAQAVVIAENYDGTNYDDSCYVVGNSSSSGYIFSWGANFTVSGTNDFSLSSVTMPLIVSSFDGGHPNPANYQISIVNDVAGQPTGEVVASFAPGSIGPVSKSYTFNVSGIVHGGGSYWLLFMPIAPDSGNIGWNFSWALQYPGIGYLAERWSASGLPSGNWTISTGSGSVQPGFLIKGIAAVPEPSVEAMVAFGALAFAVYGICKRVRPAA